MRTKLLVAALALSCTSVFAQWEPKGDKLKTKWAETLDPTNVLPEYPRPIMERPDWQNLNGLWEYAILPVGKQEPTKYDGQILVPFAVESSLSGVQKELGKDNELWYKRTFTIPSGWRSKNVLLHFGAVDWKTEVYLNDIKIGSHTGGYAPFSFDITPYLKSGAQKLIVKVWDPTTEGFQPVGKQHNRPHGIWYTPVSGIWQTVWLEPVNQKHITSITPTANIDGGSLKVKVNTQNTQSSDLIQVTLKDGNKVVAVGKSVPGQTVDLYVPDMKLWWPESPFLYDMEVAILDKGKAVDKVNSYAAMRKISRKKDKDGIVRMQLNNKDCFHFGPLDQGWWPDGLYTAPTDEALVYDIQKTKDFGYNMIRKHVKVEPARWYTHCDRLGILVWQDMPNGDKTPQWQMYQYFDGKEMTHSIESEDNFRKEWKEIMDYLMPYPSIAVWVPFNEAWGQFKTVEIAEWTKYYDPSRLVNPASGGNHYKVGDILDYHKYPGPEFMMYDPERVTVVGEYGGIGFPMKDHLWQTDKNWGYVQFKSAKEVTDEYIKYGEELLKLVNRGISGAVYTQTTDVEVEVNGLITYDRKVIKLEEDRLREMNRRICNSLSE
ncbi:glycoside hydrolase family 2 protein [Bacteroides sp. 224]|uniref:glycoside hydrolase family 2 protein n=1 Tax=Bacteroides sp. 224 TaxID=2302936 RepID=UPI0013D247C0|nr:sugar-binding domain-containing protein [Bacteroides sp. 224]NDV66311.1 beta-galactosidase [Bacteroides sp. 224]